MFLNNFINITVPCNPFIGAVFGCSVHKYRYIINIMYTRLLARVSEVLSSPFFQCNFRGFGTSNVGMFSSLPNLLKNIREFPRPFSGRNVSFFSPFNRLETCFPGLLQASGGLIAPLCIFINSVVPIRFGGREAGNAQITSWRFLIFSNPVILTPVRYNGGQVYIKNSNL